MQYNTILIVRGTDTQFTLRLHSKAPIADAKNLFCILVFSITFAPISLSCHENLDFVWKLGRGSEKTVII